MITKFSGPTSFAPLILAAIDIVEQSNWQYHVLVIVADGQVWMLPYRGLLPLAVSLYYCP